MYIELIGFKLNQFIKLLRFLSTNLFTIVVDQVEKLKSIPGLYRNMEGVGGRLSPPHYCLPIPDI